MEGNAFLRPILSNRLRPITKSCINYIKLSRDDPEKDFQLLGKGFGIQVNLSEREKLNPL